MLHFNLTHFLNGSMNTQTQIGTNAVVWGVVSYLIYNVHLANEIAARKSFLRLLDKNRELMRAEDDLMRAEDDKKALADDIRMLEADNERIRKEVAISGMNEMQVQIVQVRPLVCCMQSAPSCRQVYPILITRVTLDNRRTLQILIGMSAPSSSLIGGRSSS